MDGQTREYIELSGVWQIVFDPHNEGVRNGWTGAHWPDDRSLPVHVPGIWNIDYPDAEGVGFYRTAFTIPESWRGKAIVLHFEGAIYRCEAWIGGKFIGSHEGGYTPFWFHISDFIQFREENNLVVRVTALSKTRAVDGMILQQTPLSKQSWYYVFGGLWGRVTLEAVPLISCHTTYIDPDLRRERAQVEVGLQNWRDEYRQVNLTLRVLDPRGNLVHERQSQVPVPPGLGHYTFVVHLPKPMPWSCEHPDLYRLEIQLDDEDVLLDSYSTQFGMRDFTIQNGQFILSGEAIYIRGILLQPNFPVNLITHPNREMMVREITLAKEAGFNLIRLHLQPAAPGFLDLADQMGMLVYAETCLAWIRESPRMLEHGRREVTALIERDRNHPSIVFWGIYNENPPAAAANGRELVHLARNLDPTRVIIDNSGGSLAIDQDFGWIDRATVTPARQAQAVRNLDIHVYLGSPVSGAIYNWLRNLGSGAPSRVLVEEGFGSLAVMDEFDRECRSFDGKIFVSELGYGGMSDLVETVAGFGGREDLLDARELKALRDSLLAGFQERDLGRIFGTPHGLSLEAQKLQSLGNTQQLEAIMMNPRVSGYVMTQLNDVSWEFHGGLLDLWRNPKLSYYAAQRMNQPQVIQLRARRTAIYRDEQAELELGLLCRKSPNETVGLLMIEGLDPSGKPIYKQEFQVLLRSGIQSFENVSFGLTTPGACPITARLTAGGDILAEATETILVLEPVDWAGLPEKPTCIGQEPAFLRENNAIRVDENPGARGGMDPQLYLAAYPATLTEKQWESIIDISRSGGVVLCGAIRPGDQAAIQTFNREGIPLKVHPGIGSWMGCYHWIPDSELFDGLPAKGLAMKPYAGIIPKYILSEMGGDIQAGSLRNTQSLQDAPSMLWYSDIEALQVGKGAIVFCQYRVFDNIEHDPLAAHLAYNLLKFATRHSG